MTEPTVTATSPPIPQFNSEAEAIAWHASALLSSFELQQIPFAARLAILSLAGGLLLGSAQREDALRYNLGKFMGNVERTAKRKFLSHSVIVPGSSQ